MNRRDARYQKIMDGIAVWESFCPEVFDTGFSELAEQSLTTDYPVSDSQSIRVFESKDFASKL